MPTCNMQRVMTIAIQLYVQLYMGLGQGKKKTGNPNFNVTYGEVMLMVKLDTGKTSIA